MVLNLPVKDYSVVTQYGDGDFWYVLLKAPKNNFPSSVFSVATPSTSVGTVGAVPGNASSSAAASFAASPASSSPPWHFSPSLLYGGYCSCGHFASKLLPEDIGGAAKNCDLFFHLDCWRNMSAREQLDAYRDAEAAQFPRGRRDAGVEPDAEAIPPDSDDNHDADRDAEVDKNTDKNKRKARAPRGQGKKKECTDNKPAKKAR